LSNHIVSVYPFDPDPDPDPDPEAAANRDRSFVPGYRLVGIAGVGMSIIDMSGRPY
jgi:hypothetical protein